MRPTEVARRGAGYLARHGVDSPHVESETLLLRILDIDRTTLFTRNAGLTTAEAKAYGRALCRRCTGTPLQHLTGEQGFRRLVVQVRPGVFVPRPETEMVVDVALALAGEPRPIVIDVCTGTGAVALAIADERPGATVYATDVSAEAVELARANAAQLGLDVLVFHGDLFASLPTDLRGRTDLVVANPPYVPVADAASLPADVRADPARAVFGGVEFATRLLGGALGWLRPGGAVAIEIEERTAPAVMAAARDAGFDDVLVHPDLNGRDRVVSGRRP